VNVLAIILTARVLGVEMGTARAVGAIAFSVVIGLIMQFIFRRDSREQQGEMTLMAEGPVRRNLAQDAFFFLIMVGILVFANWSRPLEGGGSVWDSIHAAKWYISGLLTLVLAYLVWRWFSSEERKSWVVASWDFAKMILPLLLAGVFAAGFLLGRPGHEGVIPAQWVERLVGGNSLTANLFASVVGAFMYFATLTEVPILEGLIGAGMGKGPALALLLAGPALSLPNMLVIRRVIGTRRTMVFVLLVVLMATFSGIIFGFICSP